MVAVAGILLLAAARYAFQTDSVTYYLLDRGTLFPSANIWISDRWLTMTVNTALVLAIALGWLFLIQVFNPFRALTSLPASFFLIMMLSVPELIDQLNTGTLVAVTIAVCLALLWSSFADIARLRHIFLIFTILSGLCATQYCYAVYIPVFMAGCAQMKIFNLRAVAAMVLGLVTPWWILFGTGAYTVADLHFPELIPLTQVFEIDGAPGLLMVVLLTSMLLIFSWAANFMKVLKLNANLRSFNGSISLISLVTLLAVFIDYSNVSVYVPTLMLMASYQLSYVCASMGRRNGYIPVVSVMAVYVALYIFNVMV